MPLWLYILIAFVTSALTTAAALMRWSWWAGARVARVDGELVSLGARVERIEKVLNGQLEGK